MVVPVNTQFVFLVWSCSGEPAGSCVLPDVLGVVAGIQSLFRAGGLWRWSGHHAYWCTGILPGCPLERQTKVYLHVY